MVRADNLQSSLKYFNNEKKSIDVSCGDSVFSFITFGGKLSEKTDMFTSIKTSKTCRDEEYDAFDYYDKSYIIERLKNLKFTILMALIGRRSS